MICGGIEELKQSSHRNNEKQQIIVDWVKIWLSHLYSQRWVQLHDGKHVATGMTTMECKIWAKYTLTRHKGGVLGNNIPSVSRIFQETPFVTCQVSLVPNCALWRCTSDEGIVWCLELHVHWQTVILFLWLYCKNASPAVLPFQSGRLRKIYNVFAIPWIAKQLFQNAMT